MQARILHNRTSRKIAGLGWGVLLLLTTGSGIVAQDLLSGLRVETEIPNEHFKVHLGASIPTIIAESNTGPVSIDFSLEPLVHRTAHGEAIRSIPIDVVSIESLNLGLSARMQFESLENSNEVPSTRKSRVIGVLCEVRDRETDAILYRPYSMLFKVGDDQETEQSFVFEGQLGSAELSEIASQSTSGYAVISYHFIGGSLKDDDCSFESADIETVN